MGDGKSFQLLGDVPLGDQVGSENAFDEDKLSLQASATVLAKATVDTPETITIGIYGPWGTGKTSFMQMMKSVVDENNEAVGVWFNAWQFEREEHLIVPLVATIAKRLDEALDKREWAETLKDGGRKLHNALRAIAYGFSVKGKVGIPLVSEAEVNLSGKEMIDRYQELTKDAVLGRSLYFNAFEELDSLAKTKDKPRIVVFIDDLDRCFPESAVALLESIKLVLCQPGFSFVLGVDPTVIHNHLKCKYKEELGPRYYEDYLDKLIQVPFTLPSPRPTTIEGYVHNMFVKEGVFPKGGVVEFSNLAPVIANACGNNPRSVVRFLNDLLVRVRTSEQKNEEINPAMLAMACALAKERYRPLRDALRYGVTVSIEETPKDFGVALADMIRDKQADVLTVEETLSEWTRGEMGLRVKEAVRVLLENNHLYSVFSSDTGQEWLRQREVREEYAGAAGEMGGEEPSWQEIKEALETGDRGPFTFQKVLGAIQSPGGLPAEIAKFIDDLSPIAKSKSISQLSLRGCTGITDLELLKGLTNLREVELRGCAGITDLEPIKGLTNLKALDLGGCAGITDLEPIKGLTNLRNLFLSGCTGITDLEPIKGLTNLSGLSLSRCTGITDLAPLKGFNKLRRLSLRGCTGITDLEPIKGLNRLLELDLDECTGITDLEPIKGLNKLRRLDLSRCTGVADLTPIANLRAIEDVYIGESGVDLNDVPQSVRGKIS